MHLQSFPMDPTRADMAVDGIYRFCPEDLNLGDPNCSGTPREGAMRTSEDPQ